jgi:hypothetical protein
MLFVERNCSEIPLRRTACEGAYRFHSGAGYRNEIRDRLLQNPTRGRHDWDEKEWQALGVAVRGRIGIYHLEFRWRANRFEGNGRRDGDHSQHDNDDPCAQARTERTAGHGFFHEKASLLEFRKSLFAPTFLLRLHFTAAIVNIKHYGSIP